jgi:hypothetical protein
VATDDLIWQPLHSAIMGGTHRRPAWEANVLRAWARLSAPVALTINELWTTLVDTALCHHDEDCDAQRTGWHASFTIKACNVFRCARAIRAAELDPSSTDLEAVLGVEPDMALDWHRAVALGCQDLISRMLALVRNSPAGWPRTLFNEQTLMLAALTGNTNVAQVGIIQCSTLDDTHN